MSLISSSVEPTVSCSIEALREVSHAKETFDWSDYPVVGEDTIMINSTPSQSYFKSTIYEERLTPTSRSRSPPPSPTSSRMFPFSDETSSKPFVQELEKRIDSKKVAFSDILEIRTHEIVLGDHPCCLGGMALQCDWSHTDLEIVDFEMHERVGSKRRNADLRLSYGERRHRLQEVTGLSGAQLLQQEYALVCAAKGYTMTPLTVSSRQSLALACGH